MSSCHFIPNKRKAEYLCGKKPSPFSVGSISRYAVQCPECLKQLELTKEPTYGNDTLNSIPSIPDSAYVKNRSSDPRNNKFSRREKEFIKNEGMSFKEIAAKMKIQIAQAYILGKNVFNKRLKGVKE